jgi:acetoin utilization protein AcuB
MFVSDWMTKKVFTVSPDSSISDAVKLTKEKGIKHLPVVKGDKIKGLLSDRDIKEYVPSKATIFDVYELHYYLVKMKVKSVMKTNIVTTSPDTPVEEAALIMLDKNIGCLPVTDRNKLVGIISDRDLFQVLVDISGIRHAGHRIYLPIKDRPGAIKDISTLIRKHGFSLQSILTSYEGIKKGHRKLVIRLKGRGNFRTLEAELLASYIGVKIKKG